ncbi:MAG: hypothetical protein AMJ56_01760, partial [Anaerolineae bacterium SG8_19]
GFVAGRVGQELVTLLDGYGIDHDLIWVAGDTRIAHVIVEKRHNRHSHIISGQLELKANDADALLEQVKIHLPQSQWVICAGSVRTSTPKLSYWPEKLVNLPWSILMVQAWSKQPKPGQRY